MRFKPLSKIFRRNKKIHDISDISMFSPELQVQIRKTLAMGEELSAKAGKIKRTSMKYIESAVLDA